MELHEVDDLAHGPVQASQGQGCPQRGPGSSDRLKGETGKQRGDQQRQIEEELNRTLILTWVLCSRIIYHLVTLLRNLENDAE